MKLLCAVWDKKSQSYGNVMSLDHEAVAVREFRAAVEQDRSPLAKYHEDFELHQVGLLQDSALLPGEQPVSGIEPRVIITASAVVAMMKPNGQLELLKEA